MPPRLDSAPEGKDSVQTMRRKLWGLFAVVLLIAVGLGLWKAHRADDLALGLALEWIETSTGLHAAIDEMEANLRERALRIRGLTLTNPEYFEEREAFAVDSVYAQATWRTLLGRDQHFPRLHLRIDRIQLVRLADGTSNLDGFNNGEPLFGAAPRSRFTGPLPGLAVVGSYPVRRRAGLEEPAATPPDIRIDELRIYVGAIRFVDYTMGARGKPMTLDLAVNEERTYTDVTDIEQVIGEMVMSFALQALPQNIGNLLPVALDRLEESAPELMQGLRDLLGGGRPRRQE